MIFFCSVLYSTTMPLSAVSLIWERKGGMLDRSYVAGVDNTLTKHTCVVVCKALYIVHRAGRKQFWIDFYIAFYN